MLHLDHLRPTITRYGDRVTSLNFRQSARKPTDDGLRYIAELRYLESLDLSDAPITDAGLVHLGNLRNLRWLDITSTRATDEGLVRLASIKSLRFLSILRIQKGKVVDMDPFSSDACERLQTLRPDLTIF